MELCNPDVIDNKKCEVADYTCRGLYGLGLKPRQAYWISVEGSFFVA